MSRALRAQRVAGGTDPRGACAAPAWRRRSSSPAGSIASTQAEAILASGAADVIGAARQSLADPDWFLKMRTGHGAEIRRCCFTNYCEGLDQMHKQVTCKLWDREALDEPGIAKSSDGRRRLVAPAFADGSDRGGT